MNTTQKGDTYEAKAYEMITTAIKNGELGIHPASSKLFKKKGYYSKDREKDIVFDLSIEISPPNAGNYVLLYLIECKSYFPHKVPVNDVEEFYAKIIQVAGVNVKGVFITNSTFQEGAFTYGRSKGMMLIQSQEDNYNIILYRINRNAELSTDHPSFSSQQEKNQSIEEEMEDLESKTDSFFSNVFSPLNQRIEGLEYLTSERIRTIAEIILNNFDKSIQENFQRIDIPKLTEYMLQAYGLTVDFSQSLGIDSKSQTILGYLDVQNQIIRIDKSLVGSERFAFVFMHEFGHFILHKGIRMNQKTYDSFRDSEYNFHLGKHDLVNPKNWIEWQANQFAVSLLMPSNSVKVRLIAYQMYIGINRNFGKIYYDEQPINEKDFQDIVNHLSNFFQVSKTSIRYRLDALDCIIYDKKKTHRTSYLY